MQDKLTCNSWYGKLNVGGSYSWRLLGYRRIIEIIGLADGWYVYVYLYPEGPICLARCPTFEAAYAALRLIKSGE